MQIYKRKGVKIITSTKDYSSKATNKLGGIGEEWFADYCQSKGLIAENVSRDESLGYTQGIDFIVKKGRKKETKWDVKTDKLIAQTGNMFIEMYCDFASKELGWYFTSEANRICYIDFYKEILYFFKKSDLQEYIENHHNLKKANCTDYFGTFSKVRQGYLVKLQSFKKWCADNNKKFAESYKVIQKDKLYTQ